MVKITRDMLIGIGIGMILASLTILFFPFSIKTTPQVVSQIEKKVVQPEQKKEVLPPIKKKSLPKKKILVVISSGSDSQSIAKILLEKDIIKSSQDFLQMAQAFKVEKKLIAGKYTFSQNEDLSVVIKTLLQGPEKE